MNEAKAKRLKELGFQLTCSPCDGCGCEVWSREIEYGHVVSLVSIRVSGVGFEYHFELLPVEEGAWWFDANPWNAMDCLRETGAVLSEARRRLEGGIVRRSVKWLLTEGGQQER